MTTHKQDSDEKGSPEQFAFAGLDAGRRSVTIDKGHYFMRTIHQNLSRAAFVLGLSMSAGPNLVNAQPQSLTSVNKDNSSNKAELKDSVRNTKTEMTQLIETLLKNGADGNIRGIFASVIGLPKAMPSKKHEVMASKSTDNAFEKRACYVIYENVDSSAPATAERRPVCAYIVKSKRSGLDREARWFRMDLNGNLEKVVLTQGKYGESGMIVKGSGIKTDLDINSPEVKKTFEAEMDFWLKDWLKKQQNTPKKTAESTKPNSAATTL